GRLLDVAIEGDGFFRVNDGTDGTNTFYTRAGNFYLDDEGFVVTADGYFLLSDGDEKIQIEPNETESFSIAKNGDVNIVPAPTGGTPQKIGLTIFANPEGLEKVGGSLYIESPNSGEPQDGVAGDQGFGDIVSG